MTINYSCCNSPYRLRYWNLTDKSLVVDLITLEVATALTVYGIETLFNLFEICIMFESCNSPYRLRYWNHIVRISFFIEVLISCNSPYRLRYWNPKSQILPSNKTTLQQPLPFTVLKLKTNASSVPHSCVDSCNSPYRLRYWNGIKRVRLLVPLHRVATALTVYGIETKQLML